MTAKSKIAVAALVLAFGFGPVAAHADVAAADKCAAGLSAQSRMIYDETKPRIKPGVKIPDELRSAVRPMVMGGKLSRSEAQEAAEPAGKCLALING